MLRKRRWLFSAMALTVMLLCCACGDSRAKPAAPEVTGTFSVSILKVGQADAMFLRTQNHTVVIDCGESDDGKETAKKLIAGGVEHIDYLILTHFDKDHIGGAPVVLENLSVGEVILPDYEGSGDEYLALTDAFAEQGITPTRLTETRTFTLDDAVFTVYPPLHTDPADDNNNSLCVSVTHGENTFLFAGDAKKDRLEALKNQVDLAHTFLKMPHHGKYNKGTKAFVQLVLPEYTVITCSEKNPAEAATVETLEAVGSEIYYTKDGDILAISDGKTITLTQ